ncbi:MAG TPA: MerR family transcriptional regulator [Actinomycetota bacterium]
MAGKEHLSIGEVLVSLKPEFPDVTISKIRFLESEGLIEPDRTESGYRRFSESDVERLHEILRLQRDEYLPLKVIRDRLDRGPERNGPRPAVAGPRDEPSPEDEMALPATDVQLTPEELAQAGGVELSLIEELESFGLLSSRTVSGVRYYDGDSLVLLKILKDFFTYGVEPRHLRMYRHFADREAAFFQAIILPVLRQRNPEARKAASESLSDLARISRQLKQALLRVNLREYLGNG